MKLNIVDAEKGIQGQIELPAQFSEEYHPDLIARAVLAVESSARQPFGTDPDAGMLYSAKLSRRRRNYKGAYGHGISRVPRKIMSHSGTRFNWTAALAPGTVGGRQAHPPKAEKIWLKKINRRENRKAIRSALTATLNRALVSGRGHKVPEQFPFIAASSFESISKTKDFVSALKKFGFEAELLRISERKARAGRGRMRGRKLRTKSGPLIVVSSNSALAKAARNVAGVDVVEISHVNAKLLAPGAMPGRLTVYTQASIERLGKEKLFA